METPRDLSEELRAALGNPSSCFSKRTAGAGPSSLSFTISAAVTPTGIVNRAQVTGSGLSPEETACLEAIAVHARFKAPVDGAPLNVQAAVELREQPKPPAAPTSP